MAQKVSTLKADTLLDALSHAQEWMKENAPTDICWFRGVKDETLRLMPGAYWRKDYDEMGTLLQFSQEGRAFADVGEVDDWKTYYLAQHNSVPTRLLDWTENFLTALFFATDGWHGETNPCVWIIQPCCINKLSFGWSGLISPERNAELNAWMPTPIAAGSQKVTSKDGKWVYNSANPVALYPRKSNARLVAQQGTFTVHGTNRIAIDEWLIANAPNHHRHICKVVFSRKMKPAQVMSDLDDFGLRRSTIYPDLTNFVREMKERDGWQ